MQDDSPQEASKWQQLQAISGVAVSYSYTITLTLIWQLLRLLIQGIFFSTVCSDAR